MWSDRVLNLGWLVGCFGFNGPLRQYFSLYRVVRTWDLWLLSQTSYTLRYTAQQKQF